MNGVYFIRAGGNGPVKIGCLEGGDVYKRLATLQCGNHQALYLRSFIAGNMATEKQLHARFSHLHIRGEWFRVAGELKEFLAALPHPPLGKLSINPAIPDPRSKEHPAPYAFIR